MGATECLFKTNILNRALKNFDIHTIPNLEAIRNELEKWKYSIENSDLEKTKETAVQGSFMERVWGKVLGYPSIIGLEEYNQEQERKTLLDGTEADSVLGFFTSTIKDVRAVVELKDATTDLDKKQHRTNHLTPIEQAFNYLYKNSSKCSWVIVSNFKEIRLYHRNSGMTKYQRFIIAELDDDERFKEFYYILNKDNLINKYSKSTIEILYEETEKAEQEISKQFYADYSDLRNDLFKSLQENNSNINTLILFTETQKIMDRFIFICFCEDKGLLPSNTFMQVINTATNSFDVSKYRIWNQLKGLFHSLDLGNPPMNINRYNGGLFKPDEIIDSLNVPDEILLRFQKISDYDFESDLNVNILGHIFEHSIADIEKIKAEISGDEYNNEQEKRKADGIYYTPAYVTDYIVDKTIGKWMEDTKDSIKQQLLFGGFTTATAHNKDGTAKKNSIVTLERWEEIPYLNNDITKEQQKHRQAVINLHIEFFEEYSQRLLCLKVLDPACGSGAFLNSAFQYILREIQDVNKTLTSLRGGEGSLFDIDKQILENNLFGVDLNPESVEITKLSLWLQTANKNKPLTSLDHAIKCGNSLIEDCNVSPKHSFSWETEFYDIIKRGGFDIVIGNPPYGAKLSIQEKEYLSEHYETTEYNYDTYKTFMELACKLLAPKGYIGFITPSTYFVLEKGAKKLRKFLFDNYKLINVVEMFNVFPDAIVEPIISIYKKEKANSYDTFTVVSVPRRTTLSSTFINDAVITQFTQTELTSQKDYIFNYHANKIENAIKEKVYSDSFNLGELLHVTTGIKPYQTGKGTPPQTEEIVKLKPFNSYVKIDASYIPYMKSGDVQAFTNTWRAEYIKYGPWLAEANDSVIYQREKILVRQTGDYPIASYFDDLRMGNNSLHFIYHYEDKRTVELKYVLGFLNSHLIKWLYQYDNFHMVGKPLACVKKVFLDRLPIRVVTNQNVLIDIVNELLVISQKRFNELNHFAKYLSLTYEPKSISEKLFNFYELTFADFLKELKKQRVSLTDSQQFSLMDLFEDKKKIIEKLSREIFELNSSLNTQVYKIYGLTGEEIAVIESKV